jgi:DNA-binding CsgD family transcriptional regulator
MLVGRETESAGLGKLLDDAREGRSGALLLRGEAGIGKTALLEHAATLAAGFRVLRATGIESEAELPYATLHQLLRPLEDRIDRLAAPQADALRAALGLGGDEDEADRFLIGVGTLMLLAGAAEEQPLVALLDDAAWFDRASLDALGFAARRLHAEGVALLFAVREDPARPFSLPGVEELRVGRLEAADARRLLGDGLDAARRDEVVARAHGNPLALLELARSASDAPGGAEQAFADRIAALPERTRELLLVAAADSTTSLAVVGAAAARLGIDAAALEPAELDGLVLAADGAIEFRHPLVRSAVYLAAPFARRARAHSALAEVLVGEEDADRHAWHRAASVLGTDEGAAAELERTAGRAAARAGHAAASAALERAAELTPAPGDRARRLVGAARAAGYTGDQARALALLDRAGALDDPELRAVAALVRGSVALHRGALDDAFERFLEAAQPGAAPRTALMGTIRATDTVWQAGFWDRLGEIQARVAAIEPSNDEERSAAAVAVGLTSFASNDFDIAIPALRHAVATAAGSRDSITLLHAAWASAFSGDLAGARRLATVSERLSRASGAIGALVGSLISLAAWELAEGRLEAAETAAAEAQVLGGDTGQHAQVAHATALLAQVDAVRGRVDACRRRAEEAGAGARAYRAAQAAGASESALAALDLSLGNAAEALDRLSAVFSGGQLAYRFDAIDDLVEAAARAGRPGEAREAHALSARWTEASMTPYLQIVHARGRALLAEPDEADERFRDALAVHALEPWPFMQARTELSYGEFLRRARRKADARTQLRAAFEGFQRLGAAVWADRAAAELRATGESARKRDASTIDQLTPQELQIARLVAEGGRNREIADRLFLSPKTVEYHLRKVFQKLDVASRTELAKLFSSGGAPAELIGAAS